MFIAIRVLERIPIHYWYSYLHSRDPLTHEHPHDPDSHHKPRTTFWGVVISLISIAVMVWLMNARKKAGK